MRQISLPSVLFMQLITGEGRTGFFFFFLTGYHDYTSNSRDKIENYFGSYFKLTVMEIMFPPHSCISLETLPRTVFLYLSYNCPAVEPRGKQGICSLLTFGVT